MCFMNKKETNSYTGKRLTVSNAFGYLKEIKFATRLAASRVKTIKMSSFLQEDFGKRGDCTLTSILTVTKFYNPQADTQEVYDFIEKTAEKYFYNGDVWGTFPVFNKAIVKETFKKFNIKRDVKTKYLKNVGFNLKTITDLIDANTPVMLSLSTDGRDYYKAHTITIMGYINYKNMETDEVKTLLQVYDNWFTGPALINFEALNPACQIFY